MICWIFLLIGIFVMFWI